MAAFTSNIDITSGGTYGMNVTNGMPASQVANDLNGKFANIQKYLQNGLPEVWTGDALPDSLPNDKIIFYKNKLYKYINQSVSELSPAQFTTFSKTKSTGMQTFTSSYSSTSYNIYLSLDISVPNNPLLIQLTPLTVSGYCSRGDSYNNIICSAEIMHQRISGAEYTDETFGSAQITSTSTVKFTCTARSTLFPLYLSFPSKSTNYYTLYPFLCSSSSTEQLNVEFRYQSKMLSGTTFKAGCTYRVDALCYTIA